MTVTPANATSSVPPPPPTHFPLYPITTSGSSTFSNLSLRSGKVRVGGAHQGSRNALVTNSQGHQVTFFVVSKGSQAIPTYSEFFKNIFQFKKIYFSHSDQDLPKSIAVNTAHIMGVVGSVEEIVLNSPQNLSRPPSPTQVWLLYFSTQQTHQ